MRRTGLTLVAALLGAGSVTAVALASGAPPQPPPPDPPAFTVVAPGSAQRSVVAPARRSDATIDRAVRAARARAVPAATASARGEAATLAAAGGLRLGRIVGIRRDVSQLPYSDGDDGRFGTGVWCGRIFAGRRTIIRRDGTTRRVSRFRHGCEVPKRVGARVTVTFAAEPG
jgi:hypothetical protein